MDRRSFLYYSLGSLIPLPGAVGIPAESATPPDSIYSFIPVVGDGKWVWTKPPKEGTGLLEKRSFEFRTGISIEGTGAAQGIRSTTTAPVEFPEQRIDDVQIHTQGCDAGIRQVSPTVGQLMLAAPAILPGQVIAASAHIRLTLYKQYFRYSKEQFPVQQTFDREFSRRFLYDSPGIQTRAKSIVDLTKKVGGGVQHPWDKVRVFKEWVDDEPPPGPGWLRSSLGDDFFFEVVGVNFGTVDDTVTDSSLERLEALNDLRWISLNYTDVTDAKLQHLNRLTSLENLYLQHVSVTDEGMKHIGGMTNLELIFLDGTQITDEGLKHVGKLTNLNNLSLSETSVTNDGLVHLKRLKALKYLHVDDTQVTEEGAAILQRALPNCEIILE